MQNSLNDHNKLLNTTPSTCLFIKDVQRTIHLRKCQLMDS